MNSTHEKNFLVAAHIEGCSTFPLCSRIIKTVPLYNQLLILEDRGRIHLVDDEGKIIKRLNNSITENGVEVEISFGDVILLCDQKRIYILGNSKLWVYIFSLNIDNFELEKLGAIEFIDFGRIAMVGLGDSRLAIFQYEKYSLFDRKLGKSLQCVECEDVDDSGVSLEFNKDVWSFILAPFPISSKTHENTVFVLVDEWCGLSKKKNGRKIVMLNVSQKSITKAFRYMGNPLWRSSYDHRNFCTYLQPSDEKTEVLVCLVDTEGGGRSGEIAEFHNTNTFELIRRVELKRQGITFHVMRNQYLVSGDWSGKLEIHDITEKGNFSEGPFLILSHTIVGINEENVHDEVEILCISSMDRGVSVQGGRGDCVLYVAVNSSVRDRYVVKKIIVRGLRFSDRSFVDEDMKERISFLQQLEGYSTLKVLIDGVELCCVQKLYFLQF